MLEHTFIHIPRINQTSEQKIWSSKVHTWHDFLDNHTQVHLPNSKKEHILSNLQNSIDALKKKDFSHFSTLPQNNHWRLYNVLKDKTCFLDIETTGLSKQRDQITLVGIHSSDGTKIFMNGKNLDKFQQELNKYQMIVTFNGRCFDIPFIQSKFPNLKLNQYHADLRFMMKELGFKGGLKNIERERGITRSDDLEGVDGFEAVRLWHRYQRGDSESLNTLRNYLTADVENLKTLMDSAVPELKQKNFFDFINN